jgi:hypothetical protein
MEEESNIIESTMIIEEAHINPLTKNSSIKSANARYLAGNVFITPKDDSITVDQLKAKADINGDHEKRRKDLIVRAMPLILTRDLLSNNSVGSIQSYMIQDTRRYETLDNYNKECLLRNHLHQDAKDSVVINKHFSIRLNEDHTMMIDPVTKLLASGLSELLSRNQILMEKQKIGNDRTYFKKAANTMHSLITVKKVGQAGEIVEDLIFGLGKKTLEILKTYESFDRLAVTALRFAVIHEQADVTDYCLKKYSTSSAKAIDINADGTITENDIIANMIAEVGLNIMIRGDKSICLSFLEGMWSNCGDVYRSQIINLIINRSGTQTRVELMDYLSKNSLLTEDLTKEVYSLNQPEVSDFYNKVINKKSQLDTLKNRNRSIEDILASKPNNLDQEHLLFAELVLACEKEFAKKETKLDKFIESNLNKLEPYFLNITKESFKDYFGNQNFIELADILFNKINIEALIRDDEKSNNRPKEATKTSKQKTPSYKNKTNDHKADSTKATNVSVTTVENLQSTIITKEEEAEFKAPKGKKKSFATSVIAEQNLNSKNLSSKSIIIVQSKKKSSTEALAGEQNLNAKSSPAKLTTDIESDAVVENLLESFPKQMVITEAALLARASNIDEDVVGMADKPKSIAHGKIDELVEVDLSIKFGSFADDDGTTDKPIPKSLNANAPSFVAREEAKNPTRGSDTTSFAEREQYKRSMSGIPQQATSIYQSQEQNFQQPAYFPGPPVAAPNGALYPSIYDQYGRMFLQVQGADGNIYLQQFMPTAPNAYMQQQATQQYQGTVGGYVDSYNREQANRGNDQGRS